MGVRQLILNTLKHEGPTAFYKGLAAPLLGTGVGVSIQFGVNKTFKSILGILNININHTHIHTIHT